jgi:D-glycero-D-manno-heptose 1,7-bisphosphate phosphatase
MNKAVFLDRDGVINRPLVRDGKPYPPMRVEEFEMLPGVAEACMKLKAAGFLLIVATNQPDVGRGTLAREVVEAIHATMSAALPLDRIEVCYDAGAAHGQPSEFRKPAPGMLLRAARELEIDLRQSWMVGDRWRDIDCGAAAGCRTVFIDYGYEEKLRAIPDFRARNLSEASEMIMRSVPNLLYSELYSPDIECRYEAAQLYKGIRLPEPMPRGCFGSANAFLALIGPSMGKAGMNESVEPGGVNRPKGEDMKIGYHPHFNFKRGLLWKELSAALLGDDRYVYDLTAVLNLDWSHEPDAKNVPPNHLRSGFDEHVWPALLAIKPRIVCALTNPVWDTIEPTIRQFAITSSPPFPPSILVPKNKAPVVFKFPNTAFTSMFLKSHNHPSRSFFTRKHIEQLRLASEWFRREVM